ncbi:dihydrofolate reductase-like domain-containing protein [Xylariomycetidae sp. FL2044]|nr:dihydrofolate reductase-like domain-containing protein [Xylariomycetidae sp. FL2044]
MSADSQQPTTSMPPTPLELELTLVVAATRTMGIGRSGTLPWTGLRKEMAYFARVTKRLPANIDPPAAMNAVIMGRKTWDSIPPKFRPLKGRLNIVISRSTSSSTSSPSSSTIDPETEAMRVGSLEQAIEYLRSSSSSSSSSTTSGSGSETTKTKKTKTTGKVFVIGGAQIYGAALRLREARRILLTRVMDDFECDTFFPLTAALQDNGDGGSGGSGGGSGGSGGSGGGGDGGGGGDSGSSEGWVRRSKGELDAWTGETVPEGVQEENGTRYEFQMWEKVD